MKIQIVGDGSFGSFLKNELPKVGFELVDSADSIILAIPFSSYEDFCSNNRDKHFINVCSIQEPSTNICLKYSKRVTSIHPLFGARTPADKRNSILTYRSYIGDEVGFLANFNQFSNIHRDKNDYKIIRPKLHDKLMAKTHVAAILAARQLKHFVDDAKDIPDELIPNSFRLLRNFVSTLNDTTPGTVSSILANPYV